MMKKNKLYTINKRRAEIINRPAFMPKEENLFAGPFGSSQMTFGNQASLPSLDTYLPKGLSNDTYRSLAIGSAGQMQNAFHNYGKSVIGNFGKGPLTQNTSMLSQEDPSKFFGNNPSKGGGSGASGGDGGSTMSAIGTVVGALDSVQTGDPRGMWDTLDPVYHLAGGRESAAGNAMSDAGVAVTKAGLSSGQPWMALAGAGLKIIGGLTNAAFGIKENTARKKAIEEGINRNNNFVASAEDFDDLQGRKASLTNYHVYDNGWFTSRADEMNEELAKNAIDAIKWADRSVDNNIFNLKQDQTNNALRKLVAFGGPIKTKRKFDMGGFTHNPFELYGGYGSLDDFHQAQANNTTHSGVYANGGAIEYGFMSDYLTMKNKQAEAKNKMTSLFAGTPNNFFDIGGVLQTHGGDFSDGLITVNAGGSHEENPNDGVQMGVDPEGTPNLVEEGETIWNDYVFSNRIKVPEEAQKWLGVKGKDLTFAEASKQLEKEIKERPNDPVSVAGFNAQIEKLEEEQEFVKRSSSYSEGEVYNVDDKEVVLLEHNGFEYEKIV